MPWTWIPTRSSFPAAPVLIFASLLVLQACLNSSNSGNGKIRFKVNPHYHPNEIESSLRREEEVPSIQSINNFVQQSSPASLLPSVALSPQSSSLTSLSSSSSSVSEGTKKPISPLQSSVAAAASPIPVLIRQSSEILLEPVLVKQSSSSSSSSLNYVPDNSVNKTSITSSSISSSSPSPSSIEQTAMMQSVRKVTFDAADLETTREFVINKPNFCDDDNGATSDLLVVVNSAVSNFEAREAIRQTWGQFAVERGSLLLFLLGSPHPASPDADAIQERVFQEESLHGDLLQGSFIDNYYNLTLKTISLLRWVNSTCDQIKYVLKIDDDMFVNMQMVVDFCETRSFPRSVIGRLARRWKPHRNRLSKWFVPEDAFNGTVYPNFATGPAYMFSGDAVRPLLETALTLTPIYLEDVYVTGIVAERAGVRRLNHALIRNVRLKVDACTFKRFMTSHRHSPQEIVRLWKLVYESPVKSCSPAPQQQQQQRTGTLVKPAAAAVPAATSAAAPAAVIPAAKITRQINAPSLIQSSWPQQPSQVAAFFFKSPSQT